MADVTLGLRKVGASARIYMGDAAAPMGEWNGGADDDADLDLLKKVIRSMQFQTALGNKDITTTDADTDEFFRTHIAELRGASGSFTYNDDVSGTMELRLDAIEAGEAHVPDGAGTNTDIGGRGKVDFIVRPYGDGSGLLQYRFTLLLGQGSKTTSPDGEPVGTMSFTVSGEFVREQQS